MSEFDSSKSQIHSLLEQQGNQLVAFLTFSTIKNEKYLDLLILFYFSKAIYKFESE